MKILVNGCGTVGRPLAYGLFDLDFKEVYVSVKGAGDNIYDRNEKERLAVLLEKTGYKLLIAEGGDPLENFKSYGMKPIGYVNEIVPKEEFYSDLKVIVDGTPNDKSAQAQKERLYLPMRENGWKESVIYSGGSKYGIAPNYLGAPNCIGDFNRRDLLHKNVRNVSCNSTYMGKMLSIIGTVLNWEDVEFLNTDLFRRSRDVFEGQTKSLEGPLYEPKLNGSEVKRTKYIDDVVSVYPSIEKVKYFTIEPFQLPTEKAHFVNTTITFKEPTSIIDDVKQAIFKAPHAILFDGKEFDMEKIAGLAEIKMGIPYFQISAPIYWPLKLNDRQIKIVGLTPQMTIDRESKLTKIVEETKGFNSFKKSFDYALDNVNEMCTEIPLRGFNEEFQGILASHY